MCVCVLWNPGRLVHVDMIYQEWRLSESSTIIRPSYQHGCQLYNTWSPCSVWKQMPVHHLIHPHPLLYTHTPPSLHPHLHTQEMSAGYLVIIVFRVSEGFPGIHHPSTLPYVCCCSRKLVYRTQFCISHAFHLLISKVISEEFEDEIQPMLALW